MRLNERFIRRTLPAMAACALLFAACGDDDDTSATAGSEDTTATEDTAGQDTSAPAGDAVTIVDFSYDPAEITVAPGSVVTFTNEDSTAHTATADDGAFDSGSIEPGEEATVTAPDEPGSYSFTCSFHPSMEGSLVVE